MSYEEEKIGCGEPDCLPCAIISVAAKNFPAGSKVTDGKKECEFVEDGLGGLMYFIAKIPKDTERQAAKVSRRSDI